MSEEIKIEGRKFEIDDTKCHICFREMDNVKSGSGEVVGDTTRSGVQVDIGEKACGTCPEHGVSYTAKSVSKEERGNCDCEKEDCPICST